VIRGTPSSFISSAGASRTAARARGARRALVSGSVLALCALSLSLGAPAARAEEVPRDTVVFSCSAVTYTFTGFPNATGNTVKEVVYLDGSPIAKATLSFDGSTASNTLRVIVPPNEHHFMDARAAWNTNGVRGGHDQPLRGGITCPVVRGLSLKKLQRIGPHRKFEEGKLTGGVGDTIEYELLAENTGNVPLSLAPLSDERCDPGTITPGPGEALAPGASTTYQCSHVVGASDVMLDSYVNVASLTGTGEGEAVTQRSNPVEVTLVPQIKARATGVRMVEGRAFNEAVATFTDPDVSAVPADYTATIAWGDGSASSPGAITGGEGNFSVAGNHSYAEEGKYTITVTVSDVDNGENHDEASSFANVDDATLSASPVAASGPLAFSGKIATLSDENASASPGDFTVTVQWGDGAYKVKVHVEDAGGAHVSTTSTITVAAALQGRSTTPSGSAQGGGGAIGVLPFHAKSAGALPAPVFGHSANLIPVAGSVFIKRPGDVAFIPIHAATSVPMGTIIDATNGQVQLISAADPASRTVQSGIFYGGSFRVSQTTIRVHGRVVALTVLTLTGPLPKGCAARGATRASLLALGARSRGTSRKLWGNAHGNFRTVGRYAAATVRGTKWLTEDKCAGTLVRVARGVVSVKDFPHHRVLTLRQPHSFVAHPGRGG
jgi:hypothetical protein